MKTCINKKDAGLLALVAEHRVLTVPQIAVMLDRNKQALQRRLAALKHLGCLRVVPVDTATPGRPEHQAMLTDAGIELLVARGALPKKVPHDQVTAGNLCHSAHHRLVNWFRVHLGELVRRLPVLTTAFLSPTSASLQKGADGRAWISDRVRRADLNGDPVQFTPDGVFMIRHPKRGKTVLFFLEADMGTETLNGGREDTRDIRAKILNYQAYFRTEEYKRYEQTWACPLRGFRLLFLADTRSRFESLCRLVRQVPPCDFVWVTHRDAMRSTGLAAEIWARGGKADAPPASIVGQDLSRQAMVPLATA